jgi:hypothetical protein
MPTSVSLNRTETVHDDKFDERQGKHPRRRLCLRRGSLSPCTFLVISVSTARLVPHTSSTAQSVGCHHRTADPDKIACTIETILVDQNYNLSNQPLPILLCFVRKERETCL